MTARKAESEVRDHSGAKWFLVMEMAGMVERIREGACRTFDCPNCTAGVGEGCVYKYRIDGAKRSHGGRYQLAIDAGLVPWIVGFRRAPSDFAADGNVGPGGDPTEDYPVVVAVEARAKVRGGDGALLPFGPV